MTRTNGAIRLQSLDVFRGLTIFAMLIVNDSGDFSRTYAPLLHAEWERLTPTDLVFPFFLFIVGVSMVAALRPYLQRSQGGEGRALGASVYLGIARRAVLLVLLGLFINGFPHFDIASWRIPGVLQRIGVCYFIAALIVLHVPLRWQWWIGAGILAGYAIVLLTIGAPGVSPGQLESTANLPRFVDLAVFTPAHVFRLWPTEPEGLLSTPAAVVSVLIGCWTGYGVVGRTPTRGRGLGLIAVGLALATLGWVLTLHLPAVKVIWTPTYVLYSAGWAIGCFGICYLLIDVRPMPRWLWVTLVFGRNAILAYVLAELTALVLFNVEVNGTALSTSIDAAIRAALGDAVSAEAASLVYACLFTLVMWLALFVPYRRRWFLRV